MNEKRVIKKYPNRRLYDTATSCYITLEDVKQLILEQIDVEVQDAKTQTDITRGVLLQIILEEETVGVPIFTCDVLTQIIRFYGNAMQGLMGNYLEKNMQMFMQMQQRLQEQTRSVYGEGTFMNPNVWSDFLKFQGPPMQGMLTSYLEQSTNMFVEMQQQLQDSTRNLFGHFAPSTQEKAPESNPDPRSASQANPQSDKEPKPKK